MLRAPQTRPSQEQIAIDTEAGQMDELSKLFIKLLRQTVNCLAFIDAQTIKIWVENVATQSFYERYERVPELHVPQHKDMCLIKLNDSEAKE